MIFWERLYAFTNIHLISPFTATLFFAEVVLFFFVSLLLLVTLPCCIPINSFYPQAYCFLFSLFFSQSLTLGWGGLDWAQFNLNIIVTIVTIQILMSLVSVWLSWLPICCSHIVTITCLLLMYCHDGLFVIHIFWQFFCISRGDCFASIFSNQCCLFTGPYYYCIYGNWIPWELVTMNLKHC